VIFVVVGVCCLYKQNKYRNACNKYTMAAILLFLKDIPKKLVGDAKACFHVQTTAALRGSQAYFRFRFVYFLTKFNPLNAKLNPICHLLSMLGAHLILHISRIRIKLL
jgi:hypothetical protein